MNMPSRGSGIGGSRLDERSMSLLQCPSCLSSVRARSPGDITCSRCGRKFVLDSSRRIPILVRGRRFHGFVRLLSVGASSAIRIGFRSFAVSVVALMYPFLLSRLVRLSRGKISPADIRYPPRTDILLHADDPAKPESTRYLVRYSSQRLQELSLILSLAHIKTGTAIDIGCDMGFQSMLLSSRQNSRCVAFDLGHSGLRYGNYLKQQLSLDRLTFCIGTVSSMTMFRNNSFDLVLCSYALDDFPDKRGALLEMKRIMKPDGVLVSIIPSATGNVNRFSFHTPPDGAFLSPVQELLQTRVACWKHLHTCCGLRISDSFSTRPLPVLSIFPLLRRSEVFAQLTRLQPFLWLGTNLVIVATR